MENNQMKFSFTYIDELKQESTLTKTYTTDGSVTLDSVLEQFKSFLKVSGFSDDLIDRIQLQEEYNDEFDITELFYDEEHEKHEEDVVDEEKHM